MEAKLTGKVAGVETNVKELEEKIKNMDTGKKEILVTIREFLKNGGNLNRGREVYSMDASEDLQWPIGIYLGWDDAQNCPLARNRSFRSMPISIENKILVEVKPIWK